MPRPADIEIEVHLRGGWLHVPARILDVSEINRSRRGKISELPVCDTVIDRPVGNTQALLNPEVLNQYRDRTELRTA